MTDPYRVLGLDRSASDEEIKKAYRKMSRLYHPDANVNNPNAAQAEEKFKEVQAAYQQIMKEKEYGSSGYGPGSSYGSYQSGGYAYDGDRQYQQQQQYRDPFEEMFGRGFGGTYQQYGFGGSNWQSMFQGDDLTKMQAAANFLNAGEYGQALHALDGVLDRKAHWYYFCSMAHAGLGNNVNALSYARQAANLEPSNIEYQNLVHNLENGGTWYQNRSQNYGGMQVCDMNRLCCYCCMMNMCCGGGMPLFCCI